MSNGGLVEQAVLAAAKHFLSEKSKLPQILRTVASHPIKVMGAFFTAPILMLHVAWKVENPVRRSIAIVGLIVAFTLVCLAGIFLGTTGGTLFIALQFGLFVAVGFLVGTALSYLLSVTFRIFVSTDVSLVFLKMSSQGVVEYLQEISA